MHTTHSAVQHTAATRHHAATHCNTLQHTATHRFPGTILFAIEVGSDLAEFNHINIPRHSRIHKLRRFHQRHHILVGPLAFICAVCQYSCETTRRTHCNTMQTYCNMLQHCNSLQHTRVYTMSPTSCTMRSTHCSTLQQAAIGCNTATPVHNTMLSSCGMMQRTHSKLQHTATRCNTPGHITQYSLVAAR